MRRLVLPVVATMGAFTFGIVGLMTASADTTSSTPTVVAAPGTGLYAGTTTPAASFTAYPGTVVKIAVEVQAATGDLAGPYGMLTLTSNSSNARIYYTGNDPNASCPSALTSPTSITCYYDNWPSNQSTFTIPHDFVVVPVDTQSSPNVYTAVTGSPYQITVAAAYSSPEQSPQGQLDPQTLTLNVVQPNVTASYQPATGLANGGSTTLSVTTTQTTTVPSSEGEITLTWSGSQTFQAPAGMATCPTSGAPTGPAPCCQSSSTSVSCYYFDFTTTTPAVTTKTFNFTVGNNPAGSSQLTNVTVNMFCGGKDVVSDGGAAAYTMATPAGGVLAASTTQLPATGAGVQVVWGLLMVVLGTVLLGGVAVERRLHRGNRP